MSTASTDVEGRLGTHFPTVMTKQLHFGHALAAVGLVRGNNYELTGFGHGIGFPGLLAHGQFLELTNEPLNTTRYLRPSGPVMLTFEERQPSGLIELAIINGLARFGEVPPRRGF